MYETEMLYAVKKPDLKDHMLILFISHSVKAKNDSNGNQISGC